MARSSKKGLIVLIAFVVFGVLSNCSSSGSVPPFDPNKVIKEAFLIDTCVIYVHAPWHQVDPSIAYDGNNYFVVWQDRSRGSDIHGSRINKSGVVLDPAGIIITDAVNWQHGPSIGFDGTNYLVVWQDLRNDPTRWNRPDLYGTLVSQTGAVLNPEGIAITTALDTQWCPSIAFDGTNYLVVWEDRRSGSYDIYATRVNQQGTVLDSSGIIISGAANDQRTPSIAFDGTDCMVVWQDSRRGSYDIYGARVNKSGLVLDKNGIVFSEKEGDEQFPSITFNGEHYYIVWVVPVPGRTSRYNDLYGIGVSKSGEVLNTSTYIRKIVGHPKITFDGEKYLIVWNGTNALFLDSKGTLLRVFTVHRHGGAITDVVFDSTNYVFVWEDFRHAFPPYNYSDIYGARMSQSGNILDTDGFAVSTAVGEQLNPSAAFDGTNYLVVWQEHRGSSFDIYAIRISHYGVILDTASITISNAVYDQCNPVVAYDGKNYFVVWQNWRDGWGNVDIYGARVSRSGIVLDTAGIPISTAPGWQTTPAIVFDGNNYFVVWEDYSQRAIHGAWVTSEGKVHDKLSMAISTAKCAARMPTVSFDGSNYLVVWRDERNIDKSAFDIYGARVTLTGRVLDTLGIAVSKAAMDQNRPVVAFDGMNYVIAWCDERNGSSNIYCTKLSKSGIVIDTVGIPIASGAYSQESPVVTVDGIDYVVVWQEKRGDSDWNIKGAWLDSSGTAIDTFIVSSEPGDQISPALTLGYANQVLIAYTGWADSVNRRAVHKDRIWGKFHLHEQK